MSFSNDGSSNPQKTEARPVTAGRDSKAENSFVNPAVFRGSTVLYPTAEDLHAHRGEFTLRAPWHADHAGASGRADVAGRPAMRGVGLLPSGLSATTTTLLPVLKADDHLLVTGNYRTAIKRAPGGATLRRHIGLENVDDLKADLERGFAALKANA